MMTCQRTALMGFAMMLLGAATASAQTIDRIVFFGDSLSDSGNHFILTGSSSRQPFTVEPPDDSYDIGGHHFSNGSTWAEQLAAALRLPDSGSPALRAPGTFTNYAVGRARARAADPAVPVIDLRSQVERYLSDFGGNVPEGTLVAIWIGANDVSDALTAGSATRAAGILQDGIAATADSVGRLYGAGARMFLIANIPDFAYTPYIRFLDATAFPGIAQGASAVTGAYNLALDQLVTALPFLLPDDPEHPLRLANLLDTNALIAQVVASPEAFGVTDPWTRCTTPWVIGRAICSTPSRYLFWDAIHPTKTGHAAVARAALQRLPRQ